MTVPTRSAFARPPATALGWWAFGLAAAYVVMIVINTAVFMPGLEPARWFALLPGAFALFFVLGEFLVPH
jgi:hypothetical protein